VTEVYPWYCKVCLITDSDCKVAALSHQTGATGIHEGTNDTLHTIMRYVSHLTTVHNEDDIFSSGEGLIFPKGFMLGKVVCVHKGDLFYTVTVRAALDFKTLCYCTLIAKGDI
jgi:cell shape-determining protein MreC